MKKIPKERHLKRILFRAKAGKKQPYGEWLYGYYIEGTDDYEDSEGKLYSKIIDIDGHIAIVYPDSVGQFTGLTDCKGKEIFEGDIVTYFNTFMDLKDGSRYTKLLQGCVQWSDSAFVIVNPDDNSTSLLIDRIKYFGDVTVIGDKYSQYNKNEEI